MKGFLSDHGADVLQEVISHHNQHPSSECHVHKVLTLIISVMAGWNYRSQGIVGRHHEQDKLMREVTYEVLTGRNYWIPGNYAHRRMVERLFQCDSPVELWQVARDLTNGYIK